MSIKITTTQLFDKKTITITITNAVQ